MVAWQKTKYGYRFTASGTATEEEMLKLTQEVKESFPKEDLDFFVFADLRGFAIFPPECKAALEELQRFLLDRGMKRAVVVVKDDLTGEQMQLVSKKTGAYAWERYIDASTNPDWESQAMDWLLKGIDPDVRTTRLAIPPYLKRQ